MEYPKFKVCVRCFTYNQSQYITDTFDGFVLQQTNFPFVCCIADDASTDGEQEVIRNYIESNFDLSENSCHYDKETDYAFITYAQHKTNKNCFFAVLYLKENHYSIHKSRMPYLAEWWADTDYEAICEGDDYWIDPNKLTKQCAILDSDPAIGLVYSKAKKYYQTKDLFDGFWGAQTSLDGMLYGYNHVPTLTTCLRINLRKEYLKQTADDPNWSIGDIPLWLFYFKYSKVYFLDEETGVYRILPHSASHVQDFKKGLYGWIDAYNCRAFYARRYEGEDAYLKVQRIILKRKVRDFIHTDELLPKSIFLDMVKLKIYSPYMWLKALISSSSTLKNAYLKIIKTK